MTPQRIQFLDEAANIEERRILDVVGPAGTQLVIAHYQALVGQRLEGFEVNARQAGTAMYQDEWPAWSSANLAIPDLTTLHGEAAFGRREANR
jgi:hypothetical protein